MMIGRKRMMKDFNLIISTGNKFETQAECEIWFNLLAIGDETPITYKSGIQGIVLAKTKFAPQKVTKFIDNILKTRDNAYCQFLKKIVPIESVVETDLDMIANTVIELVKNHPLCQDLDSSYRISIRKRRTKMTTAEIISAIAPKLSHPVSLKEYNWIIQIEIVGNLTGVAILTDEDILAPTSGRYGYLKKIKAPAIEQ